MLNYISQLLDDFNMTLNLHVDTTWKGFTIDREKNMSYAYTSEISDLIPIMPLRFIPTVKQLIFTPTGKDYRCIMVVYARGANRIYYEDDFENLEKRIIVK